ncbi:MAG TPA: DUF2889 domain-containing protein [Noviherbaspirillum sp.]|uniref:DUF2889 domain-containing protein n=1 Tax=Noviherbaspirillum sp. TaxID=1926288 RepID=UPI002B488C2F|nr:DUF2889 domain-containing protein [Noviherbaspirillum sp.]HJV86959.1 DUF2889 domain-containing protein [Noviherbaspirillum sp.]
MPLDATPDSITREEIHTRAVIVKSYRRSDGLFDVEGHLTDVRPYPVQLPSGMRQGGEPIHDMWLRLTVDVNAQIIAIKASTHGAPYGKSCASITPAYEALVGKRVGPGFRGAVRSLVGGLKGCTHLSELLLAMGTCVIQALYDAKPHPPDVKPFSLDGCHALNTSGPIVAEFYPRWYRRP